MREQTIHRAYVENPVADQFLIGGAGSVSNSVNTIDKLKTVLLYTEMILLSRTNQQQSQIYNFQFTHILTHLAVHHTFAP